MFGSDGSETLSARVDQLEAQLERIERKLDQVLLKLGASPRAEPSGEPAWMNEVREQLQHGRKIQAIKIWREHTGQGLKDAKEAVESLQYEGGPGSAW